MLWLRRARALTARGILGMNRRNTECILDHNPRACFPRVDSKRTMRDLCRQIGVPTPALYAVLTAHSALRHLPRLLAPHEDFVLKPNRGAGGRGILVVVGRDKFGPHEAFLRHNGQRLTLGDVAQHVSSILSGLFSLGGRPDEALVQQRVVPDDTFAALSYQGTADVRVILYRQVPAMAMLRLPTKLSGGRANLHQGAIGAGVDLETGVTTHAVQRNRAVHVHPDTGAALVGFAVPHWPRILEMSRRVAAATGLGYVGVDIVLDRRTGPQLLEANARPGLAIQIANRMGLVPRLAAIDRLVEGGGSLATPDGKGLS